jgi:hypothetical protein
MLTTQPNAYPLLVLDQEIERPKIRLENRAEERIKSHAPLVFALFTSRFRREYDSMTFNHSRGGMCLEAPDPFKPGFVLYIRQRKAPADQIYYDDRTHLRTSTLAEVKWCREIQNEFSTYYQIGVKYF